MDPESLAEDTLLRLTATVSGRVQGVNFRYYTFLEAQRLRLNGWVRNERDGTVRLVAEGTRRQLTKLVEFLWRGPPSARVDHVAVGWSAPTFEFESFEVH